MKYFILLFLLFVCAPPGAHAADFKPVMIFNAEKVNDGGWNEAIEAGIKRFETKKGIDVKAINAPSIEAYEKAVRMHAEAGYNPIIFNKSGKEGRIQVASATRRASAKTS